MRSLSSKASGCIFPRKLLATPSVSPQVQKNQRGKSKANLLIQCGYSRDNWQQLELDIRKFHLPVEVESTRETAYGTRYVISAPLPTPAGRQLSLKTVWQIDIGADCPRLITLIPD
jgi:hypothetical protein